MLSKKEAKEMAKYIVLGVNHYSKIKDKINFTMDVLERYNLIEKVKLNDKIMGNSQNDLEIDEEKDELDNDIAL